MILDLRIVLSQGQVGLLIDALDEIITITTEPGIELDVTLAEVKVIE